MTEPAAPGGRWISAAAWSRRGWRTHRQAGSGSGRPSSWAAPGTIPDLAAALARRVPDRVAVSVDGQPVTHGQLDTEAEMAGGEGG